MDRHSQQAAILSEHKGVAVAIEEADGLVVYVRPLTMDDTIDAQGAADMAALMGALASAPDALRLKLVEKDGQFDAQAIMSILTPAIAPLRRCIQRCIDKPLSEIPHWGVPAILPVFFAQNFSGPRLKPWVGLLKQAGELVRASRPEKPAGASPTRPNSSSAGATQAGGPTPSTSSNSSSGVP